MTAKETVVSHVLLGLTLRTIPLVTGYVIRTGICTIGTVIFGIVYFAEPATAAPMFCMLLILSGIVGLNIVSTTCPMKRTIQ